MNKVAFSAHVRRIQPVRNPNPTYGTPFVGIPLTTTNDQSEY